MENITMKVVFFFFFLFFFFPFWSSLQDNTDGEKHKTAAYLWVFLACCPWLLYWNSFVKLDGPEHSALSGRFDITLHLVQNVVWCLFTKKKKVNEHDWWKLLFKYSGKIESERFEERDYRIWLCHILMWVSFSNCNIWRCDDLNKSLLSLLTKLRSCSSWLIVLLFTQMYTARKVHEGRAPPFLYIYLECWKTSS